MNFRSFTNPSLAEGGRGVPYKMKLFSPPQLLPNYFCPKLLPREPGLSENDFTWAYTPLPLENLRCARALPWAGMRPRRWRSVLGTGPRRHRVLGGRLHLVGGAAGLAGHPSECDTGALTVRDMSAR